MELFEAYKIVRAENGNKLPRYEEAVKLVAEAEEAEAGTEQYDENGWLIPEEELETD